MYPYKNNMLQSYELCVIDYNENVLSFVCISNNLKQK